MTRAARAVVVARERYVSGEIDLDEFESLVYYGLRYREASTVAERWAAGVNGAVAAKAVNYSQGS